MVHRCSGVAVMQLVQFIVESIDLILHPLMKLGCMLQRPLIGIQSYSLLVADASC